MLNTEINNKLFLYKSTLLCTILEVITIDIKLLNNKAVFYAMELWGKIFNLPVVVNKRLRSTLAWYIPNKSIELSKEIINEKYTLDDILIHELCHWYCHTNYKKWDDYTKDFEDELNKVGASSSCKFSNSKDGKLLYDYEYGVYECKICGKELETKDYLHEKIEGEIGQRIKEYECCNSKMYYSGRKIIPEQYIPNQKLKELVDKFDKYYQ